MTTYERGIDACIKKYCPDSETILSSNQEVLPDVAGETEGDVCAVCGAALQLDMIERGSDVCCTQQDSKVSRDSPGSLRESIGGSRRFMCDDCRDLIGIGMT